jgi:hypothetical protein
MGDELERMCKEAIVACFKVLTRIHLEGLRIKTKNLGNVAAEI